VQERVALARKAIEKNGPDALKDWAPMYLFYGCRKSDEDFLYADEWPKYVEELKGNLNMHVAFSRQDRKPDGSESAVWAKGMWLMIQARYTSKTSSGTTEPLSPLSSWRNERMCTSVAMRRAWQRRLRTD